LEFLIIYYFIMYCAYIYTVLEDILAHTEFAK